MYLPIDLKTTTLFTDRLILRPWTWDDLDDFYAYASVDGVGQMAGWNPHKSVDETRQILTKFMEHGNVFAIEHREDRRVIGSLGFTNRALNPCRAEIIRTRICAPARSVMSLQSRIGDRD